MTGPDDAGLRQSMRGLLEVIEPPPAPLDTIIRRGKGIRLRRAVAAIGCLGLGGIIAAATVLAPPSTPQEPVLPVTVPVSGIAGPDGVFASGTVEGHAWRLAVQDIADPGYGCIPAITINGTDADPMYPGPENGADVALGPAEPGVGFAFVQLPADVEGLVLDGRESLPATTATVCGQRYRIVGFAFRLTHQPQINVVRARPSWPRPRISAGSAAQDLPVVSQLPLISTATGPMSQTYGMWNNVGTTGGETASAVLASGQDWSLQLLFSPGGDCYEFSAPSPDHPDMGSCGPISTPGGAETIMALPSSYPPVKDNGATGYAVQVSPATAHLRATALRRIHPARDTTGGGRPKVCGVRGRHVTPARPPDLARRRGPGNRKHHRAAPVRIHAVPALTQVSGQLGHSRAERSSRSAGSQAHRPGPRPVRRPGCRRSL